jgi:hypothetical protein
MRLSTLPALVGQYRAAVGGAGPHRIIIVPSSFSRTDSSFLY